MTTKKVLVTRRIPQEALNKLKAQNIELIINPHDRVMTSQKIKENIKGKDGLLCLLTDPITKEIMDAAGDSLKIIANYAVGYNNIDVKAATKRNILVTNTPGVLTDTTADLTWALMFSVARKIVISDKFTRQGKFKGWAPMLHLGHEITGKTLGIIGCGRIGSAVAERAVKGFKMKVFYWNRSRKTELEEKWGLVYKPLEELLKASDFISLHVPLTSETKHLIDENELSMMKQSAIIINTSRGAVINEKKLVKYLKEEKIAGAALDVYENEPELTEGLAELDNVVLTAHIGSATIETRTKMGIMAADNIIAAFNDEKPPNCVNPEILEG